MKFEDVKAGMKVRLKSGGPIMTVEQTGDNRVGCQWFERNQLKRDTFAPEVLDEISDDRGPSVSVVGASGPTISQKARRLFGNRD